jgi:hypothetical protein
MHDILCGLGGCLQALGFFGGIALIIRASAKAKMERMKAERQMWQPVAAPSGDVAAELRALAQQVRQMQDTGHQFDLSFDAALSRLEERVSRIESRTAAPSVAAQAEGPQHVGLR